MRTEGRGQRKLGAFGYLGDAAHRFQQGYRTRTVFPVSGPAPDFLTSVAELPFGGAAGGLKFARRHVPFGNHWLLDQHLNEGYYSLLKQLDPAKWRRAQRRWRRKEESKTDGVWDALK